VVVAGGDMLFRGKVSCHGDSKDINRIVYSITGSSKDIQAKHDEGVTAYALGGQGDSLKISGSNAGLVISGGANDNDFAPQRIAA
jgi:hypothetical protein